MFQNVSKCFKMFQNVSKCSHGAWKQLMRFIAVSFYSYELTNCLYLFECRNLLLTTIPSPLISYFPLTYAGVSQGLMSGDLTPGDNNSMETRKSLSPAMQHLVDITAFNNNNKHNNKRNNNNNKYPFFSSLKKSL